jgi:peptide/nickel transport system permease protein
MRKSYSLDAEALPQDGLAVAGRAWKSLSISGRVGLVLVIFWLFIAVFGAFLSPYSPISATHWLGSDYLGRDTLSRVLSGTRYTVGLAFFGALLASASGTFLALFAAVSQGMLDEVISRLMDTLISIPSKIFALVLVAVFGASLPLLLLTAAIIYLPGSYRIARALAVNLNSMDYVEVARVRGERKLYIVFHEILPNMLNPMMADFGLRFVFVVLLLSGMSFLGLGVQPPAADLGSLVRENMSGLQDIAPAILAPAIAIATLTIGVNLLIDALPQSGNGKGGH